MAAEELQHALQRVSGTTLDAQGAANVWAGTGMVRTNLVTNPCLGVDATGWTGSSGTRVTQGTGWAWQIDGSVGGGTFATQAGTCAVGQFVSGSVLVLGPAGRTASFSVHDGVGYMTPSRTVTLTGVPQTVTFISTNAATGTSPRIYEGTTADGGAWTAGQMLTVTNALLEVVSGVGVPAGPYFDGSILGAVWTGTPNASTSTLYVAAGKDLVGALNAKAGTSGLDLDGVLNALAGTPGQGLGVNACAAALV